MSLLKGSHLRVDGVSFSYPDRRVLTNVSFVVSAGDRIGLIGENGSGKSTLLRVLAGFLEPSVGTITLNYPDAVAPTIGLLRQEPPFSPTTSIAQAIETAVEPARRAVEAISTLAAELTNRPDDLAIANAYAAALENAEHLAAWDVDTRVSAMLNGLGLGEIEPERRTRDLSGGQRARLALVWLLLSAPDVLLLDEPTNHLDDEATAYLVSLLTAWRGPVLFASHDRAFLDEAATSLLDLDPSPIPHDTANHIVQDETGSGIGITSFTGNYSDYLDNKAAERRRWEQQYRDEQAEISRLRSQVKEQQTVGHSDWRPRSEVRMAKKFYADRNARVVSRRVNNARTRLAELEKSQIRKPPQELKFAGLIAAGLPSEVGTLGPILNAVDVSMVDRLRTTSLSISSGEKWLITGPNGSGKSTLLSILAETVQPTAGHVTRSSNVSVRLLTQETELPDVKDRGSRRSVLEAYTGLVGEERATVVPLNTFGLFAGRDLNRPLEELSVGQQRRLALAVLLANPPDILLLDEPTNHFSLSLVTELENALNHYPGTVVIASHDRWLRERWAGNRFALLQL